MPPTKSLSQEETNKALIRSFVEEIFNERNLSSIQKYFGKNSVEGRKGGKGFKQFLSEFFKVFPDWHTDIEHIVAENDFVVVFLNGFGTQKGEFQGMPPTNP